MPLKPCLAVLLLLFSPCGLAWPWTSPTDKVQAASYDYRMCKREARDKRNCSKKQESSGFVACDLVAQRTECAAKKQTFDISYQNCLKTGKQACDAARSLGTKEANQDSNESQ